MSGSNEQKRTSLVQTIPKSVGCQEAHSKLTECINTAQGWKDCRKEMTELNSCVLKHGGYVDKTNHKFEKFKQEKLQQKKFQQEQLQQKKFQQEEFQH